MALRTWRSASAEWGMGDAMSKRQRTVTELPAVWTGKCLADWLQPRGLNFKGLLVPRSPIWSDPQATIDNLVAECAFGKEQTLQTEVVRGPRGGFQDLPRIAAELVGRLALPEDLARVITQDIQRIGSTLGFMCPGASTLCVKLEIMGENNCSRWHQDHYVGRAIVSYNSGGTVYTADSNVDFWELKNCGNNDCIIRDPSKVYQVRVGDIFFIKGDMYPAGANGLVHKSPVSKYHLGGEVVNRLVLKVDLP
mmetsp:Transcript_87661/g.253166  ORF Transcript_87661/g.253166 Transcript_87661/m.253166 type:complete len:251 (-) Transcript_87661:281-1033(-)